jgi:hypothetical protein
MMFTGGEEGVQEELTELLTFRNQHRRFWAHRGIFDLESDPSEHLVIVRREIGSESVVSIVNTSSTEAVKLPAGYAKGWKGQISQDLEGVELKPFGFLMATK